MRRSIFTTLTTAAIAAVAALAIATTDTALGRALDVVGRVVVDLYRMGALALYAVVASIPLPVASFTREPAGTATQRSWLVPGEAHVARMDVIHRPTVQPGWRMCPST